jgi:hypothetical protein
LSRSNVTLDPHICVESKGLSATIGTKPQLYVIGTLLVRVELTNGGSFCSSLAGGGRLVTKARSDDMGNIVLGARHAVRRRGGFGPRPPGVSAFGGNGMFKRKISFGAAAGGPPLASRVIRAGVVTLNEPGGFGGQAVFR